jgi:hypothetical protein
LEDWRGWKPEVAIFCKNQDQRRQQQGQRDEHLPALLLRGIIPK